MSGDIIGVEDFNIYTLGAEAVSYHLKDIHTLALQATRENIGILALELAVELLYDGNDAYFRIRVERGTDENPEAARMLAVHPNDWLVILWDEIHLYRDYEFRNTFSFDGLSAPPIENVPRMTSGDVKTVGAQIEENFGQPTQVMTPVGGPGIEDSGPMTEITATVGELDTDEANGKID